MKITSIVIICAAALFCLPGCDKPPSQPQTSNEERRKVQELEAQLQQLKAKSDTTLTREKALAAVKQHPMEPVTKTFSDIQKLENADTSSEAARFIRAATQTGHLKLWPFTKPPRRGMLTGIYTGGPGVKANMDKRPEPKDWWDFDNFVSLTDEGLKYFVTEERNSTTLLMASLEPTEIVNIGAPSQWGGKTVSIVNLKVVYQPTPFGSAYNTATGKNFYSGWTNAVAQFVSYDDGWHCEGLQIEK